MNIGLIGRTGNIGQCLADEAQRRGHHITAIVRDAARIPQTPEANTTWRVADVLDADGLARVLGGVDVLVSAFQPGNASRDFDDTVRRSIEHPEVYAVAARAMLQAIAAVRPSLRLIIVGGAGSLESRPGVTLVDTPDELRAGLRSLGLPEAYAVAVAGHRDALDVLRRSNRNWTYFSPAEQIGPGERTGRFRVGGDQPVRAQDGTSRISYADAAIALIDEIELPRFVQRRFTIGY